MDHIRQRDWCSTRHYNEDFVDEVDTEDCVVERIIRNQFWDPLISSDEEEPIEKIDWDSVFKQKNTVEHNYRIFVPGYRIPPQHPKLSALTQDEHRRCIKVLSARYPSILPREFVGRPCKADNTVFEEKKAIYAAEQKEYIEWAKQLWISTNCIRALRPKPTIEMVYEAEFQMKTHRMQSFPKTYTLAAQIPLRADNQNCEIILPKKDLIQVDISSLPEVEYPNIYEGKVSVLHACTVPEPCTQHPCKFQLPNENTETLLPLTEIHKELAQYALDNDAGYIASESAIKCLLELDRNWCLPVSVCEALGPDGDKSNIVVLGSEFPMKKDPAPVRSYRAFKHLLVKAFTSKLSRTVTDESDNSKNTLKNLRSRHNIGMNATGLETQRNTCNLDKRPSRGRKVSYTNALKKIRQQKLTSDDSDDENRLEIDLDDGKDDGSNSDEPQMKEVNETDDINEQVPTEPEQPRKILKARKRRSIHQNSQEHNNNSNHENEKNNHEENHDNSNHENSANENEKNNRGETHDNSNHQNSHSGIEKNNDKENHDNDVMDEGNNQEQIDIGLFNCVCKDSDYESAAPRSFKNWQIKNHKTKEQVNIIIHNSHKLRNEKSNEVVLEPIVEYQLDVGATEPSSCKMQALAFSLMLRKNADLVIVRVDGMGGEVVTVDRTTLRGLAAERGDCRQLIANAVCTATNQLAGLLPGTYLLNHEPAHGPNALLYARATATAHVGLVLDTAQALPAAEEARLVQVVPALAPVLLPTHKYRRHLPLSFTHEERNVVRETPKVAAKKKPPPAAIQWPKNKKSKRKRKKRKHFDEY